MLPKHIVFIDLSYFVFFRFYALQRWCKISKQTFSDDEDGFEKFLAKFEKLFISNLTSLKKKLKVEWSDIYLVKDCARSSIWRVDHYPEYKNNRDEQASRATFDPRVFAYTYQSIIPSLQKTKDMHVIEYPTAEADDIIAVLHKSLRDKDKTMKITIVTNDNDYVQLVDDKTDIINLNNISLKERFTEDVLDCYKLWKVIKGDTSDNIPPIDKNIGDKTALKLAKNPDILKNKLDSDPNVKRRFDLNRLLINFDMIPHDIVSGINSAGFISMLK